MSSRTVPANRPRTPAGRITASHRELTVGSLIRAAADYETDAVAAVVRRSTAGNGVIRTGERLIPPLRRGLGGDRDPAGVPVAAERLFRRAMCEVLVAARPTPGRSRRWCPPPRPCSPPGRAGPGCGRPDR